MPVLGQYLDWISLMAYDYHGHWDGRTGHVAPLYFNQGDTFSYFNSVSIFIFCIYVRKLSALNKQKSLEPTEDVRIY